MFVTKRNGNEEEVQFDKITERISKLIKPDESKYINAILVGQKVVAYIHTGITTEELDIVSADRCINLSTTHPLYSNLGGRILVSNLHKKTSDSFSETVITVQIDKYDDDVSIVSAGFCRNKSFKPFAFKITDDGLPKIIEDYDIEMKSKKKGFDVLNLSSEEKFQLLEKVFENGERFQHSELVLQIRIVLDKNFNGSKGKGENKIIKLITESKNEGWLIQNGNRQPYELGIPSV